MLGTTSITALKWSVKCKGTRWRVGNGRLIHIWEDKWLPTPTTFKFISPKWIFDDFPMVLALINQDTKRWNASLVGRNFLPFKANTILNIPLSYSLLEDKLTWTRNKRGEFSVKSGYYVALPIVETTHEGESSSGNPWTLLWKRMWNLNIPAKIIIFAWRACMNALPTMQNLRTQGVNTYGFCPLCDHCLEKYCSSPLCLWYP